MTHCGPFQSHPFCDSVPVILSNVTSFFEKDTDKNGENVFIKIKMNINKDLTDLDQLRVEFYQPLARYLNQLNSEIFA